MTSVSLSELLKEHTRLQHDALECRLRDFLAGITIERYETFLQRWYGFIAPWEETVSSRLPVELSELLGDRRKARSLESDLSFLSKGSFNKQSIPLCDFVPDLRTVDDVLGSMYVIEGATLGGKVIRKMLERQLALPNGAGFAFFSSYGNLTMKRWLEFKELLDVHCKSIGAKSVACGSAQETFNVLSRWLLIH